MQGRHNQIPQALTLVQGLALARINATQHQLQNPGAPIAARLPGAAQAARTVPCLVAAVPCCQDG